MWSLFKTFQKQKSNKYCVRCKQVICELNHNFGDDWDYCEDCITEYERRTGNNLTVHVFGNGETYPYRSYTVYYSVRLDPKNLDEAAKELNNYYSYKLYNYYSFKNLNVITSRLSAEAHFDPSHKELCGQYYQYSFQLTGPDGQGVKKAIIRLYETSHGTISHFGVLNPIAF